MMKVVIVDQNRQQALATAQMLQLGMSGQIMIDRVDTGAAIENLSDYLTDSAPVDCILLDCSSLDKRELDLIEQILAHDPFAAIIVTSHKAHETTGVEALKRGAMDFYIRRDFTESGLERAIVNAVDRSVMARRIDDQQQYLRTFADVLVHDLRAPLRSVWGGIGMLFDDLPQDILDTHAEELNFVKSGAEQMDQLIVSLHRFCSLEVAELQLSSFDLDDTIQKLRQTLRADLMARGASLTACGEMPVVHTDQGQMLQLLQNLVGNAIKYNRSPSPRVQISAVATAEGQEIQVADNGVGIEAEYLEEIFEPFRRLQTTAEFEGSGLGLATCRRIANRMGGRLTCQSTFGEGSVFTLLLPWANAKGQVQNGQANGTALDKSAALS